MGKRPYKKRHYHRGKRCSKGEKRVATFLDRNGIVYEMEQTFDSLRSPKNRPLRFDFYLSDHKVCIEYDGHHHQAPVNKYRKAKIVHNKTVIHDKIKDQFCKNNRIKLIRIPHTKYDLIDSILTMAICIPPKQLIDKIANKTIIKTDNECWEYQGYLDRDGYGRIGYQYKHYAIHRLIYEFSNFCKINKNQLVCHSCDNPSCINPKHLFLGTTQDNNLDKMVKWRHAYGNRVNSSKLTDDIVVELLRNVYDGRFYTRMEISKYYSISYETIVDILRFRTWKHLHSHLTDIQKNHIRMMISPARLLYSILLECLDGTIKHSKHLYELHNIKYSKLKDILSGKHYYDEMMWYDDMILSLVKDSFPIYKLTQPDINDVKMQHESGIKISQIANKYGIPYNTVNYHISK